MKIRRANPIYDSVFKYLVEDRRIARTLISALLKKEVVDVRMNPHSDWASCDSLYGKFIPDARMACMAEAYMEPDVDKQAMKLNKNKTKIHLS